MVSEPPVGRSLVDLARDGDAAAFESLVRSRMNAVYELTAARWSQASKRAQERALGEAVFPRADGEVLRAAIGRLSLDHRAVLALHHLDGRPVAEVAEILRIPVGTAKSRLFKARADLEKALRQEEGR
jgi:DNA-directed RNA polymerase specialized sigma24 family protein